jgi:hypothetical protein
MLLSNVGLSTATLASICKMRKESKFLNESESRTYNGKENWQKYSYFYLHDLPTFMCVCLFA